MRKGPKLGVVIGLLVSGLFASDAVASVLFNGQTSDGLEHTYIAPLMYSLDTNETFGFEGDTIIITARQYSDPDCLLFLNHTTGTTTLFPTIGVIPVFTPLETPIHCVQVIQYNETSDPGGGGTTVSENNNGFQWLLITGGVTLWSNASTSAVVNHTTEHMGIILFGILSGIIIFIAGLLVLGFAVRKIKKYVFGI